MIAMQEKITRHTAIIIGEYCTGGKKGRLIKEQGSRTRTDYLLLYLLTDNYIIIILHNILLLRLCSKK